MSVKVYTSNKNRLLGPLKPLESNLPVVVPAVQSWDVEITQMKRQIPHPVTPMMYNHAVVNLRNIPSSTDSCQEVVMLNRDTDSVEVLLMNDDDDDDNDEKNIIEDDDVSESVLSEVSSISSNSILDTESEYSNTTITTHLEEEAVIDNNNDHDPETCIVQESELSQEQRSKSTTSETTMSISANLSNQIPNPIISPKQNRTNQRRSIEDHKLLWNGDTHLESFHSYVPEIPLEISDIPLELSISVDTGYSPHVKQLNNNNNNNNNNTKQSSENPLDFARNVRAKKREMDNTNKSQGDKIQRKNLFQKRVDSHVLKNFKSSALHSKNNNTTNQSLTRGIKEKVTPKQTPPLTRRPTLEADNSTEKTSKSSTICKSPLKSRLGRVSKYYDVMSKKEQEKQERETMRLELKRQLTTRESQKKLDTLQSKTKHSQKVLGISKSKDDPSPSNSIDIPFKARPLYSKDNSTPVKGVSLGRDLTPSGRRKLALGTTNLPSIIQNKDEKSSTYETITKSRYKQHFRNTHGNKNCKENSTTNTKNKSFNTPKPEINNTRENNKPKTKHTDSTHNVPRISLGELTNRKDIKTKSVEYKKEIQAQRLRREIVPPSKTVTDNILTGRDEIMMSINSIQKKQDDSKNISTPKTVIRSVNALKSDTGMTTQQKLETNHFLSSDMSVYSEKSNFSKKSQEYLTEEERQRSVRRKQRLISLIHHAITCEAEGLFETGPNMDSSQDILHSDATYRMLQHARRCQFDGEECDVPSCKRFKTALRHYLRCKSRNAKNGNICQFCDTLPKTL